MPISPTYPGVYIEEVRGGVRTITGVATSITAFIGRALRGPVDKPITINSFADFERTFGGLWSGSALGFAVRDFYANGGSQAIIVRLYRAESGTGAKPAVPQLNANNLVLEAAEPGSWGNQLRARIEAVDPAIAAEVAPALGVGPTDLFTLLLRDMKTGAEQMFRNVTTVESARRVDRILANESLLMRVKTLAAPTAHGAPAAGKTVWEDNNASDGVAAADQASDGQDLNEESFTGAGKEAAKQGLYALEQADLFNLLCLPPYKSSSGIANQDVDATLVGAAAVYCEKRRAMLIVDPPSNWDDKGDAKSGVGAVGTRSKNAALYFPRLVQPNPLRNGQLEQVSPCGAVAGILARTDATRGLWKAPAGLDATITGAVGLSVNLTDGENGELNPLGINCLRAMPPSGLVVWGARTLQGDDRLASEWKYLPVRRTALFIEESLYRGTQWVVFEPNDEPLWAQIRLNIGAFMQNLFRQGAFQGKTPAEAYFVKCDKETTTQHDINLGIVNIVVGFAPLKPAEFVIIKIQQMAGQIQA
ncbi:Phage tail protein [Nitrospira tepida]|uniref:Phage tail protein n=1 Tax=Nitrospira tepida TaxID=2973512 RepID=A0AA86T8K9_9BACT|nr:phage tail sheath subtilisin-like domain-containing protein [Nitrospira tepida]CAI4033602.1 Phage tail protein [Nitrospira tepida]